MQHDQRLHFLSFLRVLATGAVIFGHASAFFGGFLFTQWPQFPYIQNIAVTVFFCVSGYVIAWVCDRRRDGDGVKLLVKFVFDRFSRLAIPLFPFLFLCALVEQLLFGSAHPYLPANNALHLLGNMLFLQWLTPELGPLRIQLDILPFGLNRALWTLALEFWTYILFAGVFYGFLRARPKWIPLLLAACAFTVLGDALFKAQGDGLPLIWLCSALTYFLLQRLPVVTQKIRAWALVVLVASVGSLFLPGVWPEDGGYTKTYNILIYLSFLASLIAVSGSSYWMTPPSVIGFAAGFAYSVYIVHYPILYVLHQYRWVPEGNGGVLLSSGIVVFAGWLWGLIFERHYRTIRDSSWISIKKVAVALASRR